MASKCAAWECSWQRRSRTLRLWRLRSWRQRPIGSSKRSRRPVGPGTRASDVKRRLTEEEKSIRLASQEQRAKVAGQGQLIGLFVNSKARGAIACGRSASRQAIASREASALQPYRNVKAAIDRQLGQLQSVKEDIDAALVDVKASATTPASKAAPVPASPPPPPPPPTPPTWAADPYGRHELRYWDGSRWTQHVSDNGEATVDPV